MSRIFLVICMVCAVAYVERASAAELKPEAARGFDQYIGLTEARIRSELSPGGGFLRVDGLPADRKEAQAKLRQGEVITQRLDLRDGSNAIRTPGALIHHWVGTVFIPDVSLRQVMNLLQDYDHHSVHFAPEVAKSKTIGRTDDRFHVYLRLVRKKVITVVLDTEYEVQYQNLGPHRAASRSHSTRIVEVAHAGESTESAIPVGNDHGFLWRLYSYWKFAESDHGVYVQCEAVSLTRDIPTGLGWMVGTFVESIPRESLEFTLRSLRTALSRDAVHDAR